MKRFVLYLVLSLSPLAVLGQGVVEGVVTDAKNGLPLEFVNVGIPGRQTGTATNSKGFYKLELKGDDSVTVRFSFTGYEPAQFRVSRRNRTELDVKLKPMATQLQAVEVSDEKTRQSTFT